jgi:hypothetical protein
MRCYKEFATTYGNDSRLKGLAQARGGFEGAVKKFLTARSQLAIHCCIMGNPTSRDGGKLLSYLIDVMPQAVEVKSVNGVTPLQIAFELYDDLAARILIGAGADQTARDKNGRNILHCLLTRHVNDNRMLQKLPVMLDLIDQRILPSLFQERCAVDPGSLTPLAMWMANSRHSSTDEQDMETMRILLRYGGGDELGLINGEGDTPLHVMVRRVGFALTKTILEHDPTLLNRENATGRTAYDIAEDATIAEVLSDPPPMPGDYRYQDRRARKYGLSSHWATSITDRPETDFVESIDSDRRTDKEKIWDLVRETKQKLDAEGRGMRRLVTLNEANEVARRLASKNSRPTRSTGDEGEDGEEERPSYGDEVQLWLNRAGQRIP